MQETKEQLQQKSEILLQDFQFYQKKGSEYANLWTQCNLMAKNALDEIKKVNQKLEELEDKGK